jgi:uncharacterized membrane protein
MMQIDFLPSARLRIDEYLHRVRDRLEGTESVDSDEVIDDLRRHIERELADAPQPISEGDVARVLDCLGRPEEIVKDDEVDWWRRTALRLQKGPEEWRLAYLSLLALSLGVVFFALSVPVAVVADAVVGGDGASEYLLAFGLLAGLLWIATSLLMSRAALTASGPMLSAEKKWLIHPSLVVSYVVLGGVALFWPAVAGFALWMAAHPYKDPLFDRDGLGTYSGALASGAVLTAFWWTILALAMRRRFGMLRVLFRPFADNWTGQRTWTFVRIAWEATLLFVGVTALLWIKT